MNEEKYVLHLLGCSNQRATHIRLVKGIVRRNSPISVLCPTLANGGICHRGGKHPKDWLRPKLLAKNHGSPWLQLWMCEGCKDKFLLKVKLKREEN